MHFENGKRYYQTFNFQAAFFIGDNEAEWHVFIS